jgi:beta-lactamase class A
MAGLIQDFFGFPPGPILPSLEKFLAAGGNPARDVQQLNLKWEEDKARDTTTPHAMATLLSAIWSGTALSSNSTTFMRGVMTRCSTGDARLRARLPKGTVVGNKTAGVGGMTHDVGVISLPAGAGDVVVAVLSSESKSDIGDRNLTIANIGRAVYDYYLFAAG